jgi:hypothetical protein
MNDPKSPHPFPRDRSFMPGRPGGEAWDDEDSVEGHAMAGLRGKLPKSSDDDQDTQGHRLRAEEGEEDTEGHGQLRGALRADDEDDTEGHGQRRGALRADEDDTEGHSKLK